VNVRLATKDDADAIWEFWQNQKDPFRCAPLRKPIGRDELDRWLDGAWSVALVEDEGRIILTESFSIETGESHLTNVSMENFYRAIPVALAWEKELTGIPSWGRCGYVPVAELYYTVGYVEAGDGVLRWVG
jgi:hypothetical protein